MVRDIVESQIRHVPVRYQRTARQFLKFGITGTIGALVDFGSYNLMTRLFGFVAFYEVLGQKIIIANNISVFLAIVSNFVFNKYWTFRDSSEHVVQQWTGYFILNFVTWTLNQLLMSYLTFEVAGMEAIFGSQRDNAAKAIAIAVILFLNFAGSKFLIFRKRQEIVA